MVHWAHTRAGLAMPVRGTAQWQFDRYGSGRPAFGDLAPGDILFFEYTGPPPYPERITHNGLYVGRVNGEPSMIHAPEPGRSVELVALTRGDYWRRHYAGAGRWR